MPSLTSSEQLVLLALAQLPVADDAYGVSIRREIASRGGQTVPLTTVYATLERLEKRGLVRSWRTEPLPERGGRARRCFALESAGVELLLSTRRVLDRMWEDVELGLPERR